MEFKEIQKLLYKEYKLNGYEEMWDNKGKIGDIAELGLIITEVSEAIEEIRRKDADKDLVMIECADIIIRTLNFITRKQIRFCVYSNPEDRLKDIEYYILMKHKKNCKRGKLHGKDI